MFFGRSKEPAPAPPPVHRVRLRADPTVADDLAQGIVMVPCGQPPRVGTRVALDLRDGTHPPVATEGMVVWSRPARGSMPAGFGASVSDPAVRERLAQLAAEARAERRAAAPISGAVIERCSAFGEAGRGAPSRSATGPAPTDGRDIRTAPKPPGTAPDAESGESASIAFAGTPGSPTAVDRAMGELEKLLLGRATAPLEGVPAPTGERAKGAGDATTPPSRAADQVAEPAPRDRTTPAPVPGLPAAGSASVPDSPGAPSLPRFDGEGHPARAAREALPARVGALVVPAAESAEATLLRPSAPGAMGVPPPLPVDELAATLPPSLSGAAGASALDADAAGAPGIDTLSAEPLPGRLPEAAHAPASRTAGPPPAGRPTPPWTPDFEPPSSEALQHIGIAPALLDRFPAASEGAPGSAPFLPAGSRGLVSAAEEATLVRQLPSPPGTSRPLPAPEPPAAPAFESAAADWAAFEPTPGPDDADARPLTGDAGELGLAGGEQTWVPGAAAGCALAPPLVPGEEAQWTAETGAAVDGRLPCVRVSFPSPPDFLLHYRRYLEHEEIYLTALPAPPPGTRIAVEIEVPDGGFPLRVGAIAGEPLSPPAVPRPGWLAHFADAAPPDLDRLRHAASACMR